MSTPLPISPSHSMVQYLPMYVSCPIVSRFGAQRIDPMPMCTRAPRTTLARTAKRSYDALQQRLDRGDATAHGRTLKSLRARTTPSAKFSAMASTVYLARGLATTPAQSLDGAVVGHHARDRIGVLARVAPVVDDQPVLARVE